MKERCSCYCRRQYIANRLSQKDSKYFVLDKMRQDKDQRNQKQHFPEQCQKDGCFRISKGNKSLLAGELDGKEQGSCHIDPERPDGIAGKVCVAGKDGNKNLWNQHT